ncbi:unnamed protein product [Strongylus vulgaris]|uniref:Uncharacterized protein n=1 Tax=Strongylus vulgaris TaxID=40348 RepID=A0A3P7IQE1_STRVU|nr:unnamed protein product [Strongylus vulgaris]
MDPEPRARLSIPVIPALCYAAERQRRRLILWLGRSPQSVGRRLLNYTDTQHLFGLDSSDKSMSCLHDPAEYVSKAEQTEAI